MSGVVAIEIIFGDAVELSREHQHRLVSLIGEICEAYEVAHPDRVMWPAGIGDKPLGLWGDDPSFDGSIFQIDCCERERFEDEAPPKPDVSYERQVLLDAVARIGWPEIHAYHAELRKGQDIYEDAGGFMVRAIARLFRIKRRDPVTTYQDAARAMIDGIANGTPS